jgi:hypothetical protein
MSSRKKGERTKIFSIFGQIEAVAAEIMIKRGVGVRIDAKEIPNEVRWNQFGTPARFAVILPRNKIHAFNELIADLRA